MIRNSQMQEHVVNCVKIRSAYLRKFTYILIAMPIVVLMSYL